LAKLKNFKFSLLTENAQKNLRPMTSTNKSRRDFTRPISGLNFNTAAEREPHRTKEKEKPEPEKDLIDKEIELLSYLTSKNGKVHDKKPSSGKVSEKIKNIEAELRALDDHDLIKRYLDEDKVVENELIDKYFGENDEEESIQNNRNPVDRKEFDNMRISEERKTETSDIVSTHNGPIISHNEFTSFLEEQKKKMAIHEKKMLLNESP